MLTFQCGKATDMNTFLSHYIITLTETKINRTGEEESGNKTQVPVHTSALCEIACDSLRTAVQITCKVHAMRFQPYR